MRQKIAGLAIAAFLMLGGARLGATTITFDEFPAGDNNVAITTLYSYLGVTFGATNSGIWEGLSQGDPGNWGLEGTNGPQFLGFNGINGYNEAVTFASPVNFVSLDFSRSNGSSDGTITLSAYDGATLLGSTSAVLGGINSWSTLSLNLSDITSIVWDGTGSGFHPYGVDNFQFTSTPEPANLMLFLSGVIGIAAVWSKLRWRAYSSD
jgi:hypothetical protein